MKKKYSYGIEKNCQKAYRMVPELCVLIVLITYYKHNLHHTSAMNTSSGAISLFALVPCGRIRCSLLVACLLSTSTARVR